MILQVRLVCNKARVEFTWPSILALSKDNIARDVYFSIGALKAAVSL
jgi:hypothetical protein